MGKRKDTLVPKISQQKPFPEAISPKLSDIARILFYGAEVYKIRFFDFSKKHYHILYFLKSPLSGDSREHVKTPLTQL